MPALHALGDWLLRPPSLRNLSAIHEDIGEPGRYSCRAFPELESSSPPSRHRAASRLPQRRQAVLRSAPPRGEIVISCNASLFKKWRKVICSALFHLGQRFGGRPKALSSSSGSRYLRSLPIPMMRLRTSSPEFLRSFKGQSDYPLANQLITTATASR